MDGCGKSSTFRGVLNTLAEHVSVVGIGDQVLSGGPDKPLEERLDLPLSRSAQIVGRYAKGLRWQQLYKILKFAELTQRTRMRDYVSTHDSPDVILTDGQPLVNSAAWSVARFYKNELLGDDEELFQALRYLTGEERIPLRELPRYMGRAWPLALLNLLGVGRFKYPDLIFLLDLDPAVAMTRIRARGTTLQEHEDEDSLNELGRGYARVCKLLQERSSIPLTRIRVDQVPLQEAVQIVADGVMEHLSTKVNLKTSENLQLETIDVIATTMSGSIQDQRNVQRIGPEFQSRTSRRVRVHLADSHAEAQAITHAVVAEGGRTIVSAGGAGTFNAVLEAAHINGTVPADLRLAFLRKGSANLIGKTLGIPEHLPEAVEAILQGIECDRCMLADILAVETTEPEGQMLRRHMVGFGGFGVFGEVPRFTESRLIKFYKAILGSLLGDLGPFYTGLILAAGWWQLMRLLGRVPPMIVTLDDHHSSPEIWVAVMVLNGDLGADFPLGRGLPLGSGSFRVVGLPYKGFREALRQMKAAQLGSILDKPEIYGAVVRTVRNFTARPTKGLPYMINVDGGRMISRGEVRISVSGQVRLVSGHEL
jgi:diacylglycerol kinase family enzyme